MRARQIDIRGDRWNAWQDVRLPFAARAVGATVLHCPANTTPWVTLTPTIVTIHDLIPVETEAGSPFARHWLRRVRRASRVARAVVTPSDYSRQAIIGRLGVPAEKITVNGWAPDRGCTRNTARALVEEARCRHGIPPGARYVLAFGAADPRKNTAGLIEAWRRVSPEARANAVLLIVGLQPGSLERYQALAADRLQDGSCLVQGFAAEEEMTALLTGAEMLCYPSKAEGFGLPVLDAFACGTPVITSTTTSLPEVAGEAARLVDPDSVDAIAAALADLLTSAAARADLQAKGYQRLAKFSWERCADTIAHVVSRVAGVS
jgi:glycosyltransferase involved in cell wall biosynthesis